MSAPASRYRQPYRYPSPDIPLSAIRRFARRIAHRFRPESIILFGSYAYGTPHAESDVDLLVIMPTSNEISKSARITVAFDPPFALDLVVRTPQHVERGLREGDEFIREALEKGKVLYAAPHRRLGAQSRRHDLGSAGQLAAQRPVYRDQVCFHCQQGSEKYLKALLLEAGIAIPRTHDLDTLLLLLVSHHPALARLRRRLRTLTRYAVDYRYPSERATSRQMHSALRTAARLRGIVRRCLGLA